MKKLSNINESAWGDMMRRGSGEIIRKEDDVNIMNFEQLCSYINDNYKFNVDEPVCRVYKTKYGVGGIITHIMDFGDDFLGLYLEYNVSDRLDMHKNGLEIQIEQRALDKLPDLLNKLKKEYELYETEDNSGMLLMWDISPKTGEVNNSFFIEVLNFITSNIK